MLGKFVRAVLVLVAVLVGVFFIGAQFLPKQAMVSRTIQIDAPPRAIWPYVSDFNAFQEWSPWVEHDPDMELTVIGAPGTVGHRQKWRSDNDQVGSGSQEIIRLVPYESVTTQLDFGEQGDAEAMLTITPAASASKVEWGFSAELDGAMMRWMGLMFDDWIGADYERGLENLKTVVEGSG